MDNNELKNISTQHKKDLKNLIKSLNEIKPNITCIGLLNAGKSTLLNALIGDVDNQTFLTADIRETTDTKDVIHNKLNYIDTPGLDATDQDTQKVIDVLKEADIVLFVHNINTGEFDPTEFDFLKLILQNWNDPSTFISQTIFVLSKIDAIDVKDEKTEIEKTSEKIKSQIYSLFNCEPTVVSVSSESYQDALKLNEPVLLAYSNFSLLREKIEELSNNYESNIYKNKIDRVDTKFKEVKLFLEKERKRLLDEKVALTKQSKEQKDEFIKDLVTTHPTKKTLSPRITPNRESNSFSPLFLEVSIIDLKAA